jgi:hypothetical protein
MSLMPHSPDTSKPTPFTQCCRDIIKMLSYEDILGCTMYLPPMFFMVGPATILANRPLVTVVLNAIVGFALSWTLHSLGHRLLVTVPNEPQAVFLFRTLRLPVNLTRTQFSWMMEMIVAAAVFSGMMGVRFLLAGGMLDLLVSAICFTMALGLYFLPVYLATLWIERYYPAMSLLGPTDDVVSRSLPGIRFLSPSRKKPRSGAH